MKETNNVTKSIAHTKWNCKYHIVFAPKYRRKVFFEEKRLEIREILRTLCAWKGVDIIEGEICPDHVHLLLSTPQVQYIVVHGIPERQECNDDISKMGEYEICIPKPRILVYRILCGHSRQKYSGDKGIHRKSVEVG